LTVDNMSNSEVPPLLRSFGVLDSKIDEASGGTGSAAWRYAVWQSGWQKIMEHPLVGKGFGNLPQRFEPSLVPTTANQTTDFEAVLAGGMAHNGYVVTAYGFGLPFTVLLTGCMVFYMLRAAYGCLNADPHDAEVRDAYAFYACVLASLFVAIYAAADLHSFLRWASCIALLANLERRTSPEAALAMEPTAPGYGNQPYATAPYRY
jgi:O-antigen ligase